MPLPYSAGMQILVTNDDGIDSPGLLALKTALDRLGDVMVIAPQQNRSAIGRGITITRPLHVDERVLPDGSMGYAVDGTPVDCVRFAAAGLVDGRVPDVVVSGINQGYNLGDDVTYSGTVAAAYEGMLLGVPAVAVSQGALDGGHWHNGGSTYEFTFAARFTAELVSLVTDEAFPPRRLVSVNIPGIPPGAIAGVRVARLGRRIYYDSLQLVDDGDERRRYVIYGDDPAHHAEDGTDFAAIENGFITVTPIVRDWTEFPSMEAFAQQDLGAIMDTVRDETR